MSEISNVKISSIDPNPMRRLSEYPYNPNKIGALRASIRDVGLWEGVIARKVGSRYQIAFGHHRIEAARQEKGDDAKVSLIVRNLTDKQMLEYMGRENLEDYNADFLCLLEAWEAAYDFTCPKASENIEVIQVAKLLGWTRTSKDGYVVSNHAALTCDAASRLIDGGYIKRKQLNGLTITSAREICGHITSQHNQLEKMAKRTGRSPEEVEGVKKELARAGGHIAQGVREGRVAQNDIRGAIDVEAYEHAKESRQQSPLFSQYIKRVAEGIGGMLKSDVYAEKLQQIQDNINNLEMEEDAHGVDVVSLECSHLAKRAEKWAKAMVVPARKVAQLRAITKGE